MVVAEERGAQDSPSAGSDLSNVAYFSEERKRRRDEKHRQLRGR